MGILYACTAKQQETITYLASVLEIEENLSEKITQVTIIRSRGSGYTPASY
ncbi:hypothetical protein [Adhaeribacter arboris]|uniref:hypothetical protein n=1 Tax=Adhaeribacter arboris TaxID=2072846 RepID=UPI001304AEE3|nr:hypothetical protein [Adhaeribacter arboris]